MTGKISHQDPEGFPLGDRNLWGPGQIWNDLPEIGQLNKNWK